jgi:hypothetical protein
MSLGGGSAAAVNRATNIKIKALEQDGISVSEDKTEGTFDDDMEDDHGDTLELKKSRVRNGKGKCQERKPAGNSHSCYRR